jgi:hypothetical protein
MKHILALLLSVFINLGFSQCDNFSKTLFELTKTKDYENLDVFLMPIEQKRKIMHWPNDSAATTMLQSLQDSLKGHIIKSCNAMHDSLKNRILDYSRAEYLACTQTEGIMSTVTINFKIDSITDSFEVQTIQKNNIYIGLPLNYKSNFSPIPPTSFTIIDGKKYNIFSARKDEKEKALSVIIAQTDYEKKDLIYNNGLKRDGQNYINYLIVNPKKETRIMVELDSLSITKYTP